MEFLLKKKFFQKISTKIFPFQKHGIFVQHVHLKNHFPADLIFAILMNLERLKLYKFRKFE